MRVESSYRHSRLAPRHIGVDSVYITYLYLAICRNILNKEQSAGNKLHPQRLYAKR